MSDLPDPRRVIGNILQIGTIETVDRGSATCQVRVGDTLTGEVCWVVQRAGKTRTWSPPSIGEQCLLLCPEGDTDNALAVLGLFSDANPAPSAEDIDLIRFADGAIVSYDAAEHLLVAQLPAGGKVRIDAPEGVEINGPLRITGDVTITGTATASEDVVGGGKSLKDHRHIEVQPGTGVSGKPQ